MSSLAEVQIRLRHWITAPEGVETALASEPGGARAVVRGDARLGDAGGRAQRAGWRWGGGSPPAMLVRRTRPNVLREACI